MKVTKNTQDAMNDARRARELKNKAEAMAAFVSSVAEINRMANELVTIADDHFNLDPDEITWANVGDVNRTLGSLKEILAVIHGEDL